LFSQIPKFAVLGSARELEDSEISRKAFQLGEEIGKLGGIVLTGGCPGLPHMAALGAKNSGGLSIAVSPAMNKIEHLERFCYPVDSDVMIFTGMGNKGRNVILIRSADIALFVGGGIGTLNEFTIAFDELNHGHVIGVLSGSGGLSDTFLDIAARSGRTPLASLLTEGNPRLLVQNSFTEFARNGDRVST